MDAQGTMQFLVDVLLHATASTYLKALADHSTLQVTLLLCLRVGISRLPNAVVTSVRTSRWILTPAYFP